MPFQATLSEIVATLSASTQNLTNLDRIVTGLTTDTRSLKPGDVFLALRGEKFDGHNFVQTAIDQGAIAAIVDVEFAAAFPIIKVADTLTAYQAIAHCWRKQFQIPIIAITGSVGKTTTKELLAAVLSNYGNVHKTQANFNNEIGVPKTLLELDQTHDFAVIEMGMRARGEIALLTQIASPTIGLITNVGTAHIGRLGSREAIAAAKCELLAEMPNTAIAILNHDNLLLMQTAKTVWQGQTMTYGLEGGDLQGQIVDANTIRVDRTEFPLPLPGEHNAQNFLAAVAIAKVLKLEVMKLTAGVTVELPSGRARRYDLPNDVVILDESYNAGLESMLASLKLLAQTPGTRRIAVLGTMKELGAWSIPFHQQVGETVRSLYLDHLLILADPAEAEAMAIAAAPVPTETFTAYTDATARLKELIRPGDRLLFKASRAVGLDRVVQSLVNPSLN